MNGWTKSQEVALCLGLAGGVTRDPDLPLTHNEALMPPSSPILGIRASQVVVYVVCLCVCVVLCPWKGQTCPDLAPDGDVIRAFPPVSCLWLGKQGPRDLPLAPHWATQLSELKLPSPVANRPNFP